MRVAINISTIKNGHKLRGIGYYTNNLLNYLEKEEELEVSEFSNISEIKNADVVHYPWFDFYFHTLPIKKTFPTVVTIHDVIPLVFPSHYPVGLKGKVNFYLQKLALRSCKFIITDSLSSKTDILKFFKFDEKKIIVIPLAADSSFKVLKDMETLRVKRRYNLPNQFLLYVGDANWTKNLPFLIEGFRKLTEVPDFKDIKLILIGGVFLKNVEDIDHPELESLKQVNRLIKRYKLEDKIMRPGNIGNDELVAFYNLSTLCIQPSLYEGFGLPVLESLSCGTPVISSNAGSLPEVGGKAVIYFDPTNLDKFVLILKDVLEDRSSLTKLSKIGLEQASKFSWEKTASATLEVYKLAAKNV